MRTNPEARSTALPLPLERQVDATCRRFEASWRAGARPRIEDYLGDVPDPARAALLAELLALELAYRVRAGEAPQDQEHRGRFPGHDALVDAAYRTLESSNPDGISVPQEATRWEQADPPLPEPDLPPLPGYEVLGRLGQGGMGVVWRGRDRRLGRHVAVKVMRAELAGRPQAARRFLEEAQVASQLAHPAIPPVHELGELPDGRPYFAMKLVQGLTLAELRRARSSPGEDLPRLLAVFEQVCQALAYAHAHGVIHRDLKPHNVMVGAFGEVQVMDWGLAKLLRGGGPLGLPTQPWADREVCPHDTQPGTVLGTYAYMAPEQARGEVERLDRRCDVFGLGAILCEVLTGQPPYVGSAEEVKTQAEVGQLAPARQRLAASGADPELVELAGRCLRARAPERPADAAAVAASMTAYLAGVQERLRRAEVERVAAQARAVEERKRRRVQMALAAAVLALVAGGTGSWLWVQRQAVAKREMVESALAKATALREKLRFGEAATLLEQGRKALGEGGPDDLRRGLGRAEAELDLVRRLDAIRQRLAVVARGGQFSLQRAERAYADAFREADLGEVGDDEEAVAGRIRDSGVSQALVEALVDWAGVVREPRTGSWLLAVARRADPDPWRDRFRDPALWRSRLKRQALAEDALRDDGVLPGKMSPQMLKLVGQLLGGGAEAVPLLRAAQRRYPSDFWLSLDLGNALLKAKQFEESVGYFRVAVALRPDSGVTHTNLGIALRHKHDLKGAIAEHRTAIRLDPQLAPAWNNLGTALREGKDFPGAIAAFEKALELEPSYADAYFNLGLVLCDTRKLAGSIAAFKKALRLAPNDADICYNLGNAHRVRRELGAAAVCYRKAVALDPRHAQAHYNLGNTLRALRDPAGAVAAFRRAIAIAPDFAEAHCNLGQALSELGRFTQALAELRRGHDLGRKRPGWPYKSGDWVRVCERLVELDRKLRAVLDGTAEPAGAAERFQLAEFCAGPYKRLPVTATRFWADAFAEDPKLACYGAACAAAQAAAGLGDDARLLPDRVVLMLRRQALRWLRTDLAMYRKMAGRPDEAFKKNVRNWLQDWQQDADLAWVRDAAALDRLSEDERKEWRHLWEEVAALLKKVEQKERL